MGAQPRWMGYVGSTTWMLRPIDLGVWAEPCTSRRRTSPMSAFFYRCRYPQAATLALVKWLDPGREQPAAMSSPGHAGWSELSAVDWEHTLSRFTESFLLGRKLTPTSAGLAPLSYSPLEARRWAACSPSRRRCRWSSGFITLDVGDIDAAAKSVTAGGGKNPRRPARSARRRPGSSPARTPRAPC